MKKFQLVEIQKRLKTDPEIARYFGVTVQYIRQERKKYKVKVIKKSTVDIERNKSIFDDFSKGCNQTEIAKKYGLTRLTIYRILKSFISKEG